MRRLLSMALSTMLMLALLLPLAAPALGQSAVATVPLCCRTHGAHKCMLHRSENNDSPMVAARCPMQTQQSAPGHAADWLVGGQRFDAAGTSVSALRVRQVEAGFRISFYRSRQKRGPPSTRTS